MPGDVILGVTIGIVILIDIILLLFIHAKQWRTNLDDC